MRSGWGGSQVSVKDLKDLFDHINTSYFHPHPMTVDEAARVANYQGSDVYLVHYADGEAVSYGFLRGWDDGYDVPTLGIAVRNDRQRHGYGRAMMLALHDEARARNASRIRLRVHPENTAARRLYDSLGYEEVGEERGEIVMVVDLA